jgi:hypothetical protein
MREAPPSLDPAAHGAGAELAEVLEPGARAALVVAHPGHELRLHGWLARVRPRVHVLTDGSGSHDAPRLASTAGLLAAVGAPAGLFGALSDRALYAALLDHDHDVFARLAWQIADALVADAVDHVVGDAAEGYNPAHDACRLVVDCAVALARRPITRWDFALVSAPDEPVGPGEVARLALSEESLARKIAVAESYADLVGEIDHARRTFGVSAFARECLRRLAGLEAWTPAAGVRPFYEIFGEYQVAAGTYARVIRHREHMVPLAEALAALAARAGQ